MRVATPTSTPERAVVEVSTRVENDSIAISGPGVLLGFGSAAPAAEERFDATERRTYDGRALAVLGPTGLGEIHVLTSAPGCEPAEILVTVE